MEVSITTISGAMQRLAMSHKHITKEAAERDELVHAMWQAEYGDIPMEAFLWLDESGVDNCTNQHCEGWAPICKLAYLSFHNQHIYCPVVNSTTVDYSAFWRNCLRQLV